MALALEQTDVGVVADHDIQIAEGGNLFKKTDVSGMEPVVAASGDNLVPAGDRWHRWRTGKALEILGLENTIGNAVFAGKFFAG